MLCKKLVPGYYVTKYQSLLDNIATGLRRRVQEPVLAVSHISQLIGLSQLSKLSQLSRTHAFNTLDRLESVGTYDSVSLLCHLAKL